MSLRSMCGLACYADIAASQLTQFSAFLYGHATGAGLISVKRET